jgi:multiple sugar transport system ATP-binding protein
VHNISKCWGSTTAVDRVSFQAEAASLVVLLGPSGCGKSTTLRLIAGLEQVSSGRIFIGGDDVTELAPAKRRIAMVFQSYALFPHLTVAENILFGLRVRKVPAAERALRLVRVTSLLGLDALLARKPSQLSGGQQQRVALGRAIIAQTPICLMDEPLSNLDAQLRAEMRHEIRALQRKLGITMVYVTHDQTEAMTLGDRVAVMRNGILQQVGSPQELYDRPDNLFVAGFIGSPSMNFMPSVVEDNTLHTPLGDVPLTGRLQRALEQARAPRELIVGIRPENFEDAALVPADQRSSGITFRSSIDVLESMGSDVFVYFTKEFGNEVDAAELRELAEDSGSADVGVRNDAMVARLDTETRAAEGHESELWADLRTLHVFNPADGSNITLDYGADRAVGGAAPATSPAAGTGRGAGGTGASTDAPAGPGTGVI